jgi:DNA (cytosine-5)-methyltransferase 1
MIKLLYIDLFCGAGGTSTGVETAKVKCHSQPCRQSLGYAALNRRYSHPDAFKLMKEENIITNLQLK